MGKYKAEREACERGKRGERRIERKEKNNK
jgi:hypothetical protein